MRLTPQESKEPVLRFVQAAVEKGVSRNINTLGDDIINTGYDGGAGNTISGGVGNNKDTGKMVITQNAPVGRRKALAGKEGGINIEVTDDSYGGGSGSSTAVNEREAMNLLSRFNFDSKRWYDRVDKLSGGERRRLQLLQVRPLLIAFICIYLHLFAVFIPPDYLTSLRPYLPPPGFNLTPISLSFSPGTCN